MATVVVLGTALSAFLGRVDWGDRGGPSLSDAGLAAHVAIIAAAVGAAAWATRALRRRP